MIDSFFLIGLPYIALFICVVGCIWRWRSHRFGISSLSSQFLEDRLLLWGSAPWHIGIFIVLLGHIFAFLFPQIWSSCMTYPSVLMATEIIGIAAAFLCILGLLVLMIRRITSIRIQAVSTTMDLVVLALLLGQVVVGLLSALSYRWGAAWASGTVTPYVWSILLLKPDPTYVASFPPLFKMHIIGAWLLILALPFSRLVHLLALPVQYLIRPPQKVVWNNPRRYHSHSEERKIQEGRRDFLRGLSGVAVGGALLSVGVLDKMFHFFNGPRLDPAEESELLEKKLRRLRMTAEERALELERQRNECIFVARLSELTATKGKYFIDYRMMPGLAFKGTDGLPLLISAKCTHLGCTVGSELNAQGKILCPCHVSFFNVADGVPDAGSPAKAPLPHIAWVLMDPTGKTIASKAPGGTLQGNIQGVNLDLCSVYIVKPSEESIG